MAAVYTSTYCDFALWNPFWRGLRINAFVYIQRIILLLLRFMSCSSFQQQLTELLSCLAFNVFGGITPSLPIQQTNATTFSWLLRFLVSEYSFIFYLQLLPTCKILDANYNHSFNELILRFLDCFCFRGIDKKHTLPHWTNQSVFPSL